VGGRLSVTKALGENLVELLEEQAQQMPTKTDWHHQFTPLTKEDINRYRIHQYTHYKQEWYRVSVQKGAEIIKDEDLVCLVRFSYDLKYPTVLGLGITQFSETQLEKDPAFKAFINGQGHISLSKAALLELTAMLKAHVEHLIKF